MTSHNGHKPSEERIGVYVCHGGSNIAGVVDGQQVAEWAAKRLQDRRVVIGRDYKVIGSSLGRALI